MRRDEDIAAYYEIAFRQHAIMNPLSAETVRAAGAQCGLGASSRVLDIGAGKGHVSLLLAREFGAACVLVDSSRRWSEIARSLFDTAALTQKAEVIEADAASYRVPAGRFNAILCLGTTPIYGGVEPAFDALMPGLADGGFLVIGEATLDETVPRTYRNYLNTEGWDFHSTAHVMRASTRAGLDILSAYRSSVADWDHYMGPQWNSILDHEREHPEDGRARMFARWAREERDMYLLYQRRYLNWTVFILRRNGG